MKGGEPQGSPPFAVWAVSDRCDNLMKIGVDAPPNLSIIRPTSGAVGTENSLRFNELQVQDGEEVRRSRGSDRKR